MAIETPKMYAELEKFRQQIEALERTSADRMVKTYGRSYLRLLTQLNALQEKIDTQVAKGEQISHAWVYQQNRFISLIRQTRVELDTFSKYATGEVTTTQREAIDKALEASKGLVKAAVTDMKAPGIPEEQRSFTELHKQAIEQMVGQAGDGTPLGKLIGAANPQTVQQVQQVLADAIVNGDNPKETAKILRDTMGQSLTRTLTISRTEVLRSYRNAAIQNYQLNADVVAGWKWDAALSMRTCPMCLAMSGKVFPLDVMFGSHPRCRCAPTPVTKSMVAELGIDEKQLFDNPDVRIGKDGEAWFNKLPPQDQQRILGPGKYNSWASGEVKSIKEFVGYKVDPDWGIVRWERSMKQIAAGDHAEPPLHEIPRVQYAKKPIETPVRPSDAGAWEIKPEEHFKPQELALINRYSDTARELEAGKKIEDVSEYGGIIRPIHGVRYVAEASDALFLPNPMIKIGDQWAQVFPNGGGAGVIYHEIGHILETKLQDINANAVSDFYRGAKKTAENVPELNGHAWTIRGTFDTPAEYVAELYSEVMERPEQVKEFFPDEYEWIVARAKQLHFPIKEAKAPEQQATRRRGRPPGSKNKPKPVVLTPAPSAPLPAGTEVRMLPNKTRVELFVDHGDTRYFYSLDAVEKNGPGLMLRDNAIPTRQGKAEDLTKIIIPPANTVTQVNGIYTTEVNGVTYEVASADVGPSRFYGGFKINYYPDDERPVHPLRVISEKTVIGVPKDTPVKLAMQANPLYRKGIVNTPDIFYVDFGGLRLQVPESEIDKIVKDAAGKGLTLKKNIDVSEILALTPEPTKGKTAEILIQEIEEKVKPLIEEGKQVQVLMAETTKLRREYMALYSNDPNYDKAKAEYFAAKAKLIDTNNLLIAKKRKFMQETLYVDPKDASPIPQINYAGTTRMTQDRKDAFQQRVEEGFSEFVKLGGKLDQSTPVTVHATTERAHAKDAGNIFISYNENVSVIVHELCHVMEFQDKTALDRAVHFLRTRAYGERTQSMRSLTGNKGYKTIERAWKDQFMEPYMGKEYVNYGSFYATEIHSVGLQYFYERPQELLDLDPEYFAFIYNSVRGLLEGDGF